MTQKGEHTWDLEIRYHRCPQCGFIIESREKGVLRNGNYEKELKCSRCLNSFVDIQATKPGFGPIFGEPTKAEVNWE